MTEKLLNAEHIFDTTAKESGLEKYVDTAMRQRFIELIDSFNINGPIADWAMPPAQLQLSSLVRTRLELARDWALYPEIEDECIDRPIFVIGSGRTGSTAMQTLLALGDGCRAPLSWECRHPSPPPGLDSESDLARIALENEHIRDLINIAPGLLLSHPYFDTGAFAEVEDEELFAVDFRTASPLHFTRVPTLPIVHHKREGGVTEALYFHKKLLQHLQWKQPTRHWVCKSTQHFFQLPSAWEVYPDASYVWTHRDPVVFLASLLGLMQHMYTQITGLTIRGEVANSVVDGLQAGYEMILNTTWPDDKRVMHVRFDDLVRDQVGVVRRIYEWRGMEFTKDYEKRIQAWLCDPANKSDRHGKYRYSLEQFGLDSNEIRSRFSSYYDRFLVD